MIYANSLLVMALCICMSFVSIILMNRRILSLGNGTLWLLFWILVGILSNFRDPLRKIMSFLSMINFTNFLLMSSSFFFIILIFFLYVNLRKHRLQIDRLTQEVALINFEISFQEKLEAIKSGQ